MLPNKCMQRRPRSEFLMLPCGLDTVPLMRGVHPLAPEAPVAPARVQDMKPSPALQIIGKMKDTLMGSAIGMIADGSDGAVIARLKRLRRMAAGYTAAGSTSPPQVNVLKQISK